MPFSKNKRKKFKEFASFSNYNISNDGGILLLDKVESEFKIISDAVKLVRDSRNQNLITHSMESILKQRIYGLCMGYSDLNDHEEIRLDEIFKSTLKKAEDLASDSTLSRIERSIDRATIIELNKLLVEKWISSYKQAPSEIILDIDWTDVELHGNQEDRFYHGYYKEYCYIPLHVTSGDELLISYLRPANKDGFRHAWAIIGLLIKRIKKEFPDCNIIVRADSGFMRHKFLGWLEQKGIKYLIAMPQNNRLSKEIVTEKEQVAEIYNKNLEKNKDNPSTVSKYKYFDYAAKSWKKERKILCKIEQNYHGSNNRFVVTNIEQYEAEALYCDMYCMRGDMENKIKYVQLDLFGDRLSSSQYFANSFRLMLSSLSYTLMQRLKTHYLKYSDLATATANTIRLRLLKLAVLIKPKKTSIRFEFSANYRYKLLFMSLLPKLFAS